MKILYVWWARPDSSLQFSGSYRPPDEHWLEEAANERHFVVRSHWTDPELELKAKNIQPDIILFSHPWKGFDTSRIDALRKLSPHSVLALLSFDYTGYTDERQSDYENILKHLDVFCAKEWGLREFWAKKGVYYRRAVQGCHPYINKVWEPLPDDKRQGESDMRPVIFMGSYSEYRDTILSRAQATLGTSLKIYSHTSGWKKTTGVLPGVFGMDRQKVLANSSCVIDISNGSGVEGYHSDRVEDTLASGVPLIVERIAGPREFIPGVHLLEWVSPDNIVWWVNKLRNDKELGKTLSSNGRTHVANFFTYSHTVQEVISACEDYLESVGRPGLPDYYRNDLPGRLTKPTKRKVLIYGQWRPQGVGYIARRIIQIVEGMGGSCKVASINGNFEWDIEHRHTDPDPEEGTTHIVFLEKCKDSWIDWAKKRGVKTLYFPMWELFREHQEGEWCKKVDEVAAIPSSQIQKALGISVNTLDWDSGLWPRRPLYQDGITFFHDARGIEQGKYNVRSRCHTDVVLSAFDEARTSLVGKANLIKLVVRVKNTPLEKVPQNVLQVHGDITRDYYFDLVRGCNAAICVSAPEGLSLPIAEFQAMSVPPLVLDVPPSNHFVDPGKTGCLIKAKDGGAFSMFARKWFPDKDHLVEVIRGLAEDPVQVRRMQEGCYAASLNRTRFKSFIRNALR